MAHFESQDDNQRAWAWCFRALLLAAFTAVFLFVALPEARSQAPCSVQDWVSNSRADLSRQYPGRGIKMAHLRFSDPADAKAINLHFRAGGYQTPLKTQHHVFTMVSINKKSAVHAVFDKNECFIVSIYLSAEIMFEMLAAALPDANMSFTETTSTWGL